MGVEFHFGTAVARPALITRREPCTGVRKTGHNSRKAVRSETKTPKMTNPSSDLTSPAPLHFVAESALPALDPGDVLLLDQSLSARQSIAPSFFAVLSCPLCGTPRLITVAEFFGGAPVLCPAEDCSALYRIVEQSHFEYLPVN